MPNAGTLYVFLHGLTVIRNQGGQMEIALPDLGLDHVYKAGSWLRETPIPAGATLELSGVATNGTKTFEQTSFSVKLGPLKLNPAPRAATLMLPPARAILELLPATRSPVAFLTRNPNIGFTQIATCQVLVYDYADENQVTLTGQYWEPCSIGGAISLHVISTSAVPEGLAHYARQEQVLAQLIDGYPGITFPKHVVAAAWSDVAHLGDLQGLVADARRSVVTGKGEFAFALPELEDVGRRQFRIERLGRLKQELRPLGGLWREPDPLDEEVTACLPLILNP